MSAPRVLPADVFDTLELSAYAFGGIGAGAWRTYDSPLEGRFGTTPFCALGHAHWCEYGDPDAPVSSALGRAGISVGINDQAVWAVLRSPLNGLGQRIPFSDWCAEPNVERGE